MLIHIEPDEEEEIRKEMRENAERLIKKINEQERLFANKDKTGFKYGKGESKEE